MVNEPIDYTLKIQAIKFSLQDGLLDEAVFQNAHSTQQTLEETVVKLETTVEMLNNRLEGLISRVGEEQEKLKQRMNKIETR